jgi:iron complex outermembrane receptor protein
MYSSMRVVLSRMIVPAAFLSAATIIQARAVTTQFDLPDQPLAESLRAVASQTDSNILFDRSVVGSVSVKPLNGQLSRDEALERLLAGTGLTFRKSDDNTVLIMPIRTAMATGSSKERSTEAEIRPATTAETPAATPRAAEPSPGGLAEIVVTAQKRSENIQSVPIAITAITDKALQAHGIQNAFDLNEVVPALNITRNVSSPLIYTRGVGVISATPGNENTTAIYVDGVYYMAPVSSIFSFSNIERIEALKGPQGTLFGRNAVGGLISVITRDPRHETAGNVSVDYGNFDTVSTKGYLTTGLSDNVAADIAFYTSQQGSGWGHNLVTGNDVYSRDESSLRTKILFTPSADWRITLTGDYSFASDDIGVAKQPIRGTFVPGGYGAPASIWDVAEGVDPFAKIRNFGGSVRVEHSLSWADLVSLTAYRDSAIHSFFDQVAGRTVQTILRLDPDGAWWGTQELQLQAPAGNKIQWIVGLYYLDADAYYDPLLQGPSATGPFNAVNSRQSTESVAGYAQASLPIFETTNLTVGARETRDERRARGYVRLANGTVLNNADLSHTWESPTWRIALDQRLAPDITGYVSYSRGFKSGVYNATALSPTLKPVNPETLDAFEGGVKSELFDSRVRLNVAAFYYNYKNQQLQLSLGQGILQFLNAADSHMYGGEVEGEARISERLHVQAGVSYLHARYSRFPDAPCTTPLPNGGNVLFPCNAAGKDMLRAPDSTANVSADYTVPVRGGSLTASANYYYNNGYFGDSGNTVRQPSYSLLNAQLAYGDSSGHWDAKLWGRNLANKAYYTFIAAGGPIGDTGTPGPPRTYGLTVGYNW